MSLIKIEAGDDQFWLLNDIPHQRGQFDISATLGGELVEIYSLNTLKRLAKGNFNEFSPDGVTPYASLSALIDDLKTFFFKTIGTNTMDGIGFIDYNDASGSFTISANTWTDLPNDGAGAYTNKTYAPDGVTELMDSSTGYIDPTQTTLGDVLLVRNDFTVNPNTNNALLEFRYSLGGGAGAYTLPTIIGRLDSGSGTDYRFTLRADKIYMGDDNTRLNPIKLQVRLSANATVTNAGTVITLI
jgi:hypothetical protein